MNYYKRINFCIHKVTKYLLKYLNKFFKSDGTSEAILFSYYVEPVFNEEFLINFKIQFTAFKYSL